MIEVTIIIEVRDEHRLRAYTSGLVPPRTPTTERVAVLFRDPHPIAPDVNGVAIVTITAEDT